MRDAILVEKIIELMSMARIATGQDTHPREFAIAAKSTPSHDQRIDDRLAHAGNVRQRAAKFRGWNMEYFGLIRCDSARTEDRCALEHRYVAHEIAFTRGSEVIFRTIARFEGFEFSAQNNCQSQIALPGFKNHVAAFHHPAFAQRLKYQKLRIVHFRNHDALPVALELFVPHSAPV